MTIATPSTAIQQIHKDLGRCDRGGSRPSSFSTGRLSGWATYSMLNSVRRLDDVVRLGGEWVGARFVHAGVPANSKPHAPLQILEGKKQFVGKWNSRTEFSPFRGWFSPGFVRPDLAECAQFVGVGGHLAFINHNPATHEHHGTLLPPSPLLCDAQPPQSCWLGLASTGRAACPSSAV